VKKVLPSYIRKSMERMMRCLDRQKGMGNNTLKMHMKVHVPFDLYKFGPLLGCDVEVGELAQKEYSKKTAQRTQRQAAKLEEQGSLRCYESMVLQRAHQHLFPGEPTNVILDDDECTDDARQAPDIEATDSNSTWSYQRLAEHGTWEFKHPKPGKKRKGPGIGFHDKCLETKVRNYLNDKLIPLLPDQTKEIHLAKSHSHKSRSRETKFHADPCNYHTKDCDEGWHDWATVRLQGKAFEDLPQRNLAHLMLIFQLDCSFEADVDEAGVFLRKGGGTYAVCELLQHTPQEQHDQSRLIFEGQKVFCDKNNDKKTNAAVPDLHIIPIEWLTGPCIVVPDMQWRKDENGAKRIMESLEAKVLIVRGKTEWFNIMKCWIEENHT
jgi:hypothetical protein